MAAELGFGGPPVKPADSAHEFIEGEAAKIAQKRKEVGEFLSQQGWGFTRGDDRATARFLDFHCKHDMRRVISEAKKHWGDFEVQRAANEACGKHHLTY